MSKGHRSEVPELYCVFASKTLQRKAPSEGCLLLRAKTKVLCYKKWKSVMTMEYILLKSAAPSSMGRLACA